MEMSGFRMCAVHLPPKRSSYNKRNICRSNIPGICTTSRTSRRAYGLSCGKYLMATFVRRNRSLFYSHMHHQSPMQSQGRYANILLQH